MSERGPLERVVADLPGPAALPSTCTAGAGHASKSGSPLMFPSPAGAGPSTQERITSG